MTQSPGLLLTLLAFALVIGPLVFIHEMGHYLAARLFGIKAETFSIGFGREIAGWTDKRGTRWKLSLLPLGGYVKFAGDMNAGSQPSTEWLSLPPEERNRTFQAKPVWQRAIVVAAGPFVNLLAAVLILAGFAMAYGVDRTPAVVSGIAAGSPAAKAGLRQGDRITALDGRSVDTWEDLAEYLLLRPGERLTISYVRADAVATAEAVNGEHRETDRFGHVYRLGRLGITRPSQPIYERVSLWAAPGAGLKLTVDRLRATLDGLGQVITGRRSLDELGGPIKIAQVSGESLTLGWIALIELIALVSINLGFINLLPVPMLDGGHLFFYAIEAVRRRPVEPQVQEWAYRGGLALILALMLFVTVNDLAGLGLWRRLAGLIG